MRWHRLSGASADTTLVTRSLDQLTNERQTHQRVQSWSAPLTRGVPKREPAQTRQAAKALQQIHPFFGCSVGEQSHCHLGGNRLQDRRLWIQVKGLMAALLRIQRSGLAIHRANVWQ
jgi:hypothetical protein